jgi:hypothetical protein
MFPGPHGPGARLSRNRFRCWPGSGGKRIPAVVFTPVVVVAMHRSGTLTGLHVAAASGLPLVRLVRVLAAYKGSSVVTQPVTRSSVCVGCYDFVSDQLVSPWFPKLRAGFR